MSVMIPLRKWRSSDPTILIGRRCIARTVRDVIVDGRLTLDRIPDGSMLLRFDGLNVVAIRRAPHDRSNSMGEGIRSLAVYGKE